MLSNYLSTISAESTLQHLWKLDEVDPSGGATTLVDSIGSNNISVPGTFDGTWETTLDTGLGLVGVAFNGDAFNGGSAWPTNNDIALSCWVKITGAVSSLQRILASFVDANNDTLLTLSSGSLEVRHEISGTATSIGNTDTYSSADGLMHIGCKIWGTGTGERELWVNGVLAPNQFESAAGIGNAGSTNQIAIGGAGNDTQIFPGAIALCSLFASNGADTVEDIDFAAHYAAMFYTPTTNFFFPAGKVCGI